MQGEGLHVLASGPKSNPFPFLPVLFTACWVEGGRLGETPGPPDNNQVMKKNWPRAGGMQRMQIWGHKSLLEEGVQNGGTWQLEPIQVITHEVSAP